MGFLAQMPTLHETEDTTSLQCLKDYMIQVKEFPCLLKVNSFWFTFGVKCEFYIFQIFLRLSG